MPMKKSKNAHKKIYDIISQYHNQDGFTTITTEELRKRTENVSVSLRKDVEKIIQKEMENNIQN